MLYAVIFLLVGLNAFSVAIIYRLVTQLTSKIMAGNLSEYQAGETRQVKRERKGVTPQEELNIPIDQIDPEEIMQSLAIATGRADEYSGYKPDGDFERHEP